jgi:hypothetical protein
MSSPERDPAVEAALTQASEEEGLQAWYRGCEPCAVQLIAVAQRVEDLLKR